MGKRLVALVDTMTFQLGAFLDELAVADFAGQHIFIRLFDTQKQLRSQAEQWIVVELRGFGGSHGGDSARPADRRLSSKSFNA